MDMKENTMLKKPRRNKAEDTFPLLSLPSFVFLNPMTAATNSCMLRESNGIMVLPPISIPEEHISYYSLIQLK